jgi:hypothetical protein
LTRLIPYFLLALAVMPALAGDTSALWRVPGPASLTAPGTLDHTVDCKPSREIYGIAMVHTVGLSRGKAQMAITFLDRKGKVVGRGAAPQGSASDTSTLPGRVQLMTFGRAPAGTVKAKVSLEAVGTNPEAKVVFEEALFQWGYQP